MTAVGHKGLIVWQKAMDLVVLVYRLTQAFPSSELYGLTSQMRRSAVSIPSNIAEGRKRGSEVEFRRFLFIAFGSGAELETQLEIGQRLGFCDATLFSLATDLLNEVMRMLNKMTSE